MGKQLRCLPCLNWNHHPQSMVFLTPLKSCRRKRPGSAHYLVARFPLSVISRADEAKQKTSRRDHGDFNEKSSAPTSKTSVRGIKVKGFNAADLSAVDDAFPSLPGANPKKDTGAAQQTKVSD